MIKLPWIDDFYKIFDDDIKPIKNSRNMKKTQAKNSQGHEIYAQNQI